MPGKSGCSNSSSESLVEEEIRHLIEYDSTHNVDGIEGQDGLNLPMGYRFRPTDAQLILTFLLNKIVGDVQPNDTIKDMDLHLQDPFDLPISSFKRGKENEAYYFARVEDIYKLGGAQPRLEERPTHSGYWKAIDYDEEVVCRNRVVGFKRCLDFYQGKAPGGEKTPWIMREYRVNPSLIPPPHQDGGLVVCRIRYKDPSDKFLTEASFDDSPGESTDQDYIDTE